MSVTWYLCLFVSLQCPGGLLAGLIPASLRPLVCTKTVEHRIYTTKRTPIGRFTRSDAGPARGFSSMTGSESGRKTSPVAPN